MPRFRIAANAQGAGSAAECSNLDQITPWETTFTTCTVSASGNGQIWSNCTGTGTTMTATQTTYQGATCDGSLSGAPQVFTGDTCAATGTVLDGVDPPLMIWYQVDCTQDAGGSGSGASPRGLIVAVMVAVTIAVTVM